MNHLLLIERDDNLAGAVKVLKEAGYKVTKLPYKKYLQKATPSRFDLLLVDATTWSEMPEQIKQPNQTPPIIFINTSEPDGQQFKHVPVGMVTTSVTGMLPVIAQKLTRTKKPSYLSHPTQFVPDHLGFQGGSMLNRTVHHYKKKELIYAEGHHPCRLMFIEKGKVKIFKKNNEGKELTVGLLAGGDFLGYTALLEESVYKDSAQAMDDTEIIGIPKEEFENLMSTDKAVAKKFIHLLASNVSEKEAQLLRLAYNSLRKRVAEALMMLFRKYKTEVQVQFSIHISREELANMVGTATESLIRTLSDFKNEKLIQIKAGNIIIADGNRLQKIAE